jgi:hypothetical protein
LSLYNIRSGDRHLVLVFAIAVHHNRSAHTPLLYLELWRPQVTQSFQPLHLDIGSQCSIRLCANGDFASYTAMVARMGRGRCVLCAVCGPMMAALSFSSGDCWQQQWHGSCDLCLAMVFKLCDILLFSILIWPILFFKFSYLIMP